MADSYPARSVIHKQIAELTSGELFRLTVYHPRLREKFVRIVREEYDDNNIGYEDIEAIKERPR